MLRPIAEEIYGKSTQEYLAKKSRLFNGLQRCRSLMSFIHSFSCCCLLNLRNPMKQSMRRSWTILKSRDSRNRQMDGLMSSKSYMAVRISK